MVGIVEWIIEGIRKDPFAALRPSALRLRLEEMTGGKSYILIISAPG